jgi:hypothetical protein
VPNADTGAVGLEGAEAVEDAGADVLPHVHTDPVAQLCPDIGNTSAESIADTDTDTDSRARGIDESRSRDPRTVRIGRDADGVLLDLAPLPQLARV